jgi:hypothetical protein
VLLPSQITPKIENVIMSSVGPDATTVALAGDTPLERRDDLGAAATPAACDATPSDVPGAFPETPAADLDKLISVNPLPAAIGAVNPVAVRPGEPLPPHATGDSIHEHVKLDKESYEKADTLPGLSELPAVAGSMIPESSLPIQAAVVSSIHPNATAPQVAAGHVPLDVDVPAVVQHSQAAAGFDPEVSAVPAEVRDKALVENELLETVAPAPSTSEGTAGFGTEKSENSTALGAAAATIGGAVVASALVAKDTIVAQAGPYVEQIKTAVGAQPTDALTEAQIQNISPEVPAEVKESIVEAGKAPEAAANTEAVEAKKAVESELLGGTSAAAVPSSSSSAGPSAAAAAPHSTSTAPSALPVPVGPIADQAPTLPEVNDVASPFNLPTFGGAAEASKATEAAPVEPVVVEAAPKPVEVPSTISEVPPSVAGESSAQGAAAGGIAAASAPAATSAPVATTTNASHLTEEPSQAATAVGDDEAPKLVDAKREGSQGSGSDKKKKHRFSALFGKIKSKFTGPSHETPKQATA